MMKLTKKLHFLFFSLVTGVLFTVVMLFPEQESYARTCEGGIHGDVPDGFYCGRSGTGCIRECGFLEFN